MLTTNNTAWAPDVTTFAAEDLIPDSLYVKATTVAGKIQGDFPAIRVPYVSDAPASFVPEGSAIPESGERLDGVTIRSAKLAKLLRITAEQAAQENTMERLAISAQRSIVEAADSALLNFPAATQEQIDAEELVPSTGILNNEKIVVASDPLTKNLDVLVDLIAGLEQDRAIPSGIIMGPATWAALRKLKVGDRRNDSLLGAGSLDAEPRLLGLPILVSPQMPVGQGLVVDSRAIVSAWSDIEAATSEHGAFSSDSILYRLTLRVGHNLLHPERIGKFEVASA